MVAVECVDHIEAVFYSLSPIAYLHNSSLDYCGLIITTSYW